jgi:hypothetical protein
MKPIRKTARLRFPPTPRNLRAQSPIVWSGDGRGKSRHVPRGTPTPDPERSPFPFAARRSHRNTEPTTDNCTGVRIRLGSRRTPHSAAAALLRYPFLSHPPLRATRFSATRSLATRCLAVRLLAAPMTSVPSQRTISLAPILRAFYSGNRKALSSWQSFSFSGCAVSAVCALISRIPAQAGVPGALGWQAGEFRSLKRPFGGPPFGRRLAAGGE